MIRKKGIEIAAVVLVVLFLAGLLWYYLVMVQSGTATSGKSMPYEKSLFGTDSVLSVDIRMDEDAFQEMIADASEETYVSCDVAVNGTTYYNVGIRPKGNSSLTQVIDSGSERFSFKLEFDHYVKGQSLYGLDKLILNNNIGDATSMKEYISYAMFQYMGVPSSLCNYAKVSVNGEYFGLYLALEGMEESFIERNYGSISGALYKPESMEMGGGKGGGKDDFPAGGRPQGGFPNGREGVSGGAVRMPGGADAPEGGSSQGRQDVSGSAVSAQEGMDVPEEGLQPVPENASGGAVSAPEGMDVPEGGLQPVPENASGGAVSAPEGGFPQGQKGVTGGAIKNPGEGFPSDRRNKQGQGADLVYTGDDPENYSSIFDHAVLDSTDTQEKRIVEALGKLSKGEDLEEYFNIDEILRYFAVNAVTVNLDSYFGTMTHNYYLYLDEDDRISILPWDYNLAFGGFQSGSTSSYVNFPIDTLVDGADRSERPLIDQILSVEKYKEQYHVYLKQLTDFIENGSLKLAMTKADAWIGEDVKADPTAFYSYEEYQKAWPILLRVCELRTQSIQGQLNGTIPSTQEGQEEDTENRIDCEEINMHDMGEQGGRGEKGPEGEDMLQRQDPRESELQKPDKEGDGNKPQEIENKGEKGNQPPSDPGENGNMPGGRFPQEEPEGKDWRVSGSIAAGCILVLAAAIIFVKRYRRKKI